MEIIYLLSTGGRLDLIYSEETPSIAKAVEKERYIKQLGVKIFLDKVL